MSPLTGALGRRHFLQGLTGAALALASGCAVRPSEELVPYVHPPDTTQPDTSVFYATSLPYLGFARGALVESVAGRPIKIDGNPDHPASLGGSDALMQAALMDLYDPDRPRFITRDQRPDRLQKLVGELRARMGANGEGLHVLTRTVASPSLAAALALLGSGVSWHRYQPVWLQSQALAEPAYLHYDLKSAPTLVSFEQDFLGTHPDRLRLAREWSNTETTLHVAESSPTMTGVRATHRVALHPADIEQHLGALASRLGVVASGNVRSPWLDRVEKELRERGGLVLAGETLSPAAQSIAFQINRKLKAPLLALPSPDLHPDSPTASLRRLLDALDAGSVKALLILDGNPAFEVPELAEKLGRAPISVHHTLLENETSALCTWMVPAAHPLEAWGDLQAPDGTLGLVQPLLQPLHGSLTAAELLVNLAGKELDSYAWTRSVWNRSVPGDWDTVLRKGAKQENQGPARVVAAGKPAPLRALPVAQGPVVSFRPDPATVDGQHANNPWLQECPRPITGLMWGNAVLVSPATAAAAGVQNGQNVKLQTAAGEAEGPVRIEAWQADNVWTVHLGNGRTRAGQHGTGVGFNAYPLRRNDEWWTPVTITAGAGQGHLIESQLHHDMDEREPVQTVRPSGKVEVHPPSGDIYGPKPKADEAWSMVIDLNKCIGCQACVVACQSENNIATVGPEQAAKGRAMHWIRVDRYDEKDLMHFQPVPCMHCENAPCERVCPVEATVHNHDGLNLMVYNRCVGTRYCANNCPYKVRRFNFLRWNEPGSFPGGSDPLSPVSSAGSERDDIRALGRNPEVTVRDRGVMEKCTYCVQRIQAARINSDKENRPIREGEVTVACQDACPTRAISFGNKNDPASEVARLRQRPNHYELLGELNTRPRTTYLARTTLEERA